MNFLNTGRTLAAVKMEEQEAVVVEGRQFVLLADGEDLNSVGKEMEDGVADDNEVESYDTKAKGKLVNVFFFLTPMA